MGTISTQAIPPSKIIDPALIDPLLSQAKLRNPGLLIAPSADMFRDPTVFYKDDVHNGLYAMSNRNGQFLEWSWASTSDGLIPSLDELVTIFKTLLDDAHTTFGAKLPFSSAFNDRCPWINELTMTKTNFLIVERIVLAVNQVLPNTAIQFDPPQQIIFVQKDTEISFGLVYGITTPLLLDKRYG